MIHMQNSEFGISHLPHHRNALNNGSLMYLRGGHKLNSLGRTKSYFSTHAFFEQCKNDQLTVVQIANVSYAANYLLQMWILTSNKKSKEIIMTTAMAFSKALDNALIM